MTHDITLYILTAALVSYAIRVLPLTLIRRPVTSRFIRSFLYYVPYVTLSVMTFPAIVTAAAEPLAGWAALAAGIVLAFCGRSLFTVSFSCCAVVFLMELIL